MRRIVAILVLAFLFCTACSSNTEYTVPVNFYYLKNPETYHDGTAAIAPEIREGANFADDIYKLIDLYFAGPVNELYISNFPDGTKLLDLQAKSNTVSIELSESFASLTGYELRIACACISLTLFDFYNADEVIICASGCQLDGNKQIIMTRDTLILHDMMDIPND